MGIDRSNFTRFGKLALSMVTSVLAVSTANAQGAEGNWGAEGRIGSGQSAYLLRWFSPTVSLVLGGGFNSSSNSVPQVNATNTSRNGNLQALLRKEWGAARVHPFIGIGPLVTYNRNSTETLVQGAPAENKASSIGIGGRFEYGGFAAITSAVDLGLVAGVSAVRTQNKNTTGNSTTESKTNTNAFSVGFPQFVIRVRF